MRKIGEKRGRALHPQESEAISTRLAAIDVGSNTVLLLIAEYTPAAGLRIIEEAEDQPRLGAGLDQSGRLSDAAIERALGSLTRMRDHYRSRGVERIAAVATAAVREAENGEEFVERVRSMGIPLRIVSPEVEAELAYRSAAYHFPGRKRLLVADIGGGSLELVGVTAEQISLTQSLPLGAVRLTELRLLLPALRDHIRQSLTASVPENWSGSTVIGSGGTFATLASIMRAQRKREGGSIHGLEVTARELESLIASLSGMSVDERRRVPGLKPERADIIVAGLAAAAELLQRVRAPVVTVNRYGLREGLLLEMIG